MISTFRINFTKHTRTMQFIKLSSSLGIGCLYFTVILLIARQSTHILHVPSFLGTNRTSTAHGLMLSLTYPFAKSSSTYLWSSFVSSGLLLYAGLLGMVASFRNTSSKSYKRVTIALGKEELSSLVCKQAILHEIQW